jgi:hypothetical protein
LTVGYEELIGDRAFDAFDVKIDALQLLPAITLPEAIIFWPD